MDHNQMAVRTCMCTRSKRSGIISNETLVEARRYHRGGGAIGVVWRVFFPAGGEATKYHICRRKDQKETLLRHSGIIMHTLRRFYVACIRYMEIFQSVLQVFVTVILSCRFSRGCCSKRDVPRGVSHSGGSAIGNFPCRNKLCLIGPKH